MVCKPKYDEADQKRCHINFKNFVSHQFVVLTNLDRDKILNADFSNKIKYYQILNETKNLLDGKHRQKKIVSKMTIDNFIEHQYIRFDLG